MDNSQIGEIVETAISNLGKFAEVNTIIGKPLVTFDGTTILPVSQITFAFMAGGGEYGNNNLKKSGVESNFAGGSGGGASLTPVGFLVIDKSGVRMIQSDSSSVMDKILQIAKDVVGGGK